MNLTSSFLLGGLFLLLEPGILFSLGPHHHARPNKKTVLFHAILFGALANVLLPKVSSSPEGFDASGNCIKNGDCPTDSNCVKGTCHPGAVDGTDCSVDSDCISNTCTDKKCVTNSGWSAWVIAGIVLGSLALVGIIAYFVMTSK